MVLFSMLITLAGEWLLGVDGNPYVGAPSGMAWNLMELITVKPDPIKSARDARFPTGSASLSRERPPPARLKDLRFDKP